MVLTPYTDGGTVVAYSFGNFTGGQTLTFRVDVDHYSLGGGCGLLGIGCDDISGAEFVGQGGIGLTLWIAGISVPVVGEPVQFSDPWTADWSSGCDWASRPFGGRADLVPEPAALMPAGAGLLVLGFLARRRRSA